MDSESAERNRHSQDTSKQQSIAGAVIGGVLVHPVAFGLACLKGLIFGASVPMAPTPTNRHGFDGALAGIAELSFVYIATVGLIPLLITLVGGGLGFLLSRHLGLNSEKVNLSSAPQAASTSPVQLAAMWASSLLIGQFCVQYLVLLSANTLYWDDLSAILFGLHLSIWLVGATVAYFKDRDMRIAAGLIGIAVLLPVLGPWLPRFILPVASLGVLLFCFSRRATRPSRSNSRGKNAP